ncbi:23S rRNA (adenine2503-C2)-methyltransferase [Bacilli bacterium PM5-3]|nr:23S rRNA (adenine2503-C2)-methyltransferase [Bacilli bacterium PM5-3]MDH6603898.1 23S rRNA (adenine2503-C2)-methyltransferase [Bacilli bacterium PM5-9]
MKNIYDLDLCDFEKYFESINEKKYRAKQLFEWIYQKRINDFSKISNMSKSLIDKVSSDFIFDVISLKEKQESADGTIKYLFELNDGNLVETVQMKYDYGNSVCVSSQVGCNMSCRFCASGQLTKKRDLTSGEMVAQIVYIQQELDLLEDRVSHIVVMGIGEPFDNYDNVMQFVRIVNNPHSLAIGARHITISTCGLIEGIKKYQEENLQTNLAISLHSAIDSTRSSLMPVNKSNDLKNLKQAIKNYIKKTNRRVTFEYIVLKGVNDSKKDAKALADYLKGLNAYINLIPYNDVANTGYKSISRDECYKFYSYLKEHNVNVTIRKEFGSDIDAACGQLRSKREGCD